MAENDFLVNVTSAGARAAGVQAQRRCATDTPPVECLAVFGTACVHVIHLGKKLVRIITGTVLVLVGAALSLPGVPGPGIAIVILGLSILSTDFEFARRAMAWLKDVGRRVLNRGQKSDPAG